MGIIALQTPVIGQPNTTEDPKIASNFGVLQTLLNGNLDASNISPALTALFRQKFTAQAGNYSAVDGDWILASAGITITLPPAVANATVRVTATSLVTSASPVTVTHRLTETLYWQGSQGATSVVLGVPNNTLTLVCDGTNWCIVSGTPDTGWIAMGLTASIGVNTITPQYRRVGDAVYVRGGFGATASFAANATIATMPTAAAFYQVVPCSLFSGGVWTGSVTPLQFTAGNVIVLTNTLTSGAAIFIPGISLLSTV